MKDIAAVLLATLFVVFSLVSLLLADPHLDRARWADAHGAASELELRYALKR
jgi:hypothetical protein